MYHGEKSVQHSVVPKPLSKQVSSLKDLKSCILVMGLCSKSDMHRIRTKV